MDEALQIRVKLDKASFTGREVATAPEVGVIKALRTLR